MVVVGDSYVGKSCIVNIFMRNTFISDSAYIPTIVDYYRKNIWYETENVLLDISDTAGDEVYMPVTEEHIRKGDCFICVFALDNLDSFTRALSLIDKIKLIKNSNPPIILVGNKLDKKDDTVIDTAVCQQKAKQYSVPYIETSAKCGLNIEEVFWSLICLTQIYKEVKSNTSHCCKIC